MALSLIIAFQNCTKGTVEHIGPPGTTIEIGSTNIHTGTLEAYLLPAGASEPDSSATPAHQFPINSTVFFKLADPRPETVNQFKWRITRGFEVIEEERTTSIPTHQATFSQEGDILVKVNAYKTTQNPLQVLTTAANRISIGDCSEIILEIVLNSGSLSQGGSPTFALEDSGDFTEIKWKIGSKEPVEANTVTLLDSDLTGSQITLEVMATDASESTSCRSHRKQVFSISSSPEPHFNYVRPVDPDHPVTFENKEHKIYKFKRTSTSKYIQINITGPSDQTCSLNDATLSACSGEGAQKDIRQSYLTQTECDESEDQITVSYTQGGTSKTKSQDYYTYCPIDKDVCYFGPKQNRPSSHHCPTITLPTVTLLESCPSSTGCDANKPENSACADNGSGCYEWTCNNGYQKSGDSCVIILPEPCPSSTDCNANKPDNSTCQDNGNGCYEWTCNNGYRRSGDRCVTCPDLDTCNNDASKPDNSTCQDNGNGCYAWVCNTGYSKSGNECVSCLDQATCNANKPSPPSDSPFNPKIECVELPADSGCYVWYGQCLLLEGNKMRKNKCYAGEPADTGIADDYTYYHKWICRGSTRTADVECAKPKNWCNNDVKHGCKGDTTVNESSKSETANYFQWKCQRTEPDDRVVIGDAGCFKAKPPACRNQHPNGPACAIGTILENSLGESENGDYQVWKCEWIPDSGNVTGECFRAKPPVCNNNTKYDCTFGTSPAVNHGESGDNWTWKCEFGEVIDDQGVTTKQQIDCSCPKDGDACASGS